MVLMTCSNNVLSDATRLFVPKRSLRRDVAQGAVFSKNIDSAWRASTDEMWFARSTSSGWRVQ